MFTTLPARRTVRPSGDHDMNARTSSRTKRMVRSLTAMLVAAGSVAAPGAEAASTRGKVARVVNGDTVRVVSGGATRSVRLLGVDAPGGRECFGAEAATALRRMLSRGAAVRLTKDGRRRGAYVRSAGKLVNQAMLAGGFARADRVARLRKGGRLNAAEGRAKVAGQGLWGACEKTPPPPAAPPAAPVAAPGAAERDRLANALAGDVLRHFDSSTGGCEFGCFQTEQALDYCTDGTFSYDFQSLTVVVFGDPVPPDVRHEEGSWRVLDATAAPDGTLSGTVELTILRGTTIDRGTLAPGALQTQKISVGPDQFTILGGERWLHGTSERCA